MTVITIVGGGIGTVKTAIELREWKERKKRKRVSSAKPSASVSDSLPLVSRNAPPTGTVTFLFTDIEGSTKLWQEDPDGMPAALARHDRILRRAVEAGGGYVVKNTGDGLHAAFAATPSAVAAALAAQRALQAESWDTPTPLLVRMGLHTGLAEQRDGDYFGGALNRAARLMAAGHGGQTLISAATQELVRDHLPGDAALRDLGEAGLKDLARPERVFQLLHPDLRADFPPLRSLDNPALPNNLPQQSTSFVGREKEVAEVTALLSETRLLTLTGTGGAGKTRLSLQVAADLLTGDGDGVWLVELAGIADPELVPQAVADVLGVREKAGKPLQQTLTEFLKPRRLLLILDNCEHLVAACASLVADLLKNCPDVHILASSRERLGVPGERIYRVPSLSLPDPQRTQTVATLSQYEAVRLFIERAQTARPSFSVTDTNAPAVAQVCYQLDGIPLAIELAAARVRTLPVEEVNTRLDRRFRLLTGGSRTLLPRQQTLRALVDWSYDLLNDQEKTLLCRLSVFAGGWTLDAAEAVGAGADMEAWEALDLLTGLVDKSLVAYEEEDGGTIRYRLLETIRQYGQERLSEGEGLEAAGKAHRDYFVSLAEQAGSQLRGPDAKQWLSRLEQEHDNLRAALSWCEQSEGEQSTEDAEAWLRLAGTLSRFWEVRGYITEGRRWLGEALTRTAGQPPSPARGRALNGAGILAQFQGDYAATRALEEEALALYRQLGDPPGMADALGNLGSVAYEFGEYETSQVLHRECLEIRRQLGDQRGIAIALGNLSNVASSLAEFGEARTLLGQCVEIFRQLGDQRGTAYALGNLGNVACAQGDYEAARPFLEQNLEMCRQMGDQRGTAIALLNLGSATSGLGSHEEARGLYEQSLILFRQLGDQQATPYVLDGLADAANAQGQSERAARLLGAAEAVRQQIGTPLSAHAREKVNQAADAIRRDMGADAFAAAWDAGRAMTLDAAVKYALSNEEQVTRRAADVL